MGKNKPNAYSCFIEDCRKKYNLKGSFDAISKICAPL